MADESPGAERNRNIWAPWRMKYIDALNEGAQGGCFLCRNRDEQADEKNFVLWRGVRCFAVLNVFPYTGGHSMVAPLEHVADLADLDAACMTEMMEHVRDLQKVLARVTHAEGFNIGINVGRCAGAGLPGHLHVHIVPRWPGDTNFMSVFGDVRVIPAALEELYRQIRRAAVELKLPKLSG
jgi:ATP adenylyltransferase